MSAKASSSPPKVYGWCPGALRPMMSGDGLVVRIRAPLGRLTTQQAAAIADLSRQYGNGLIDLSARGNLQLRGITSDGHAAVIATLQELGLLDRDAAAETRRNILVSPFWQEGDDSHVIAGNIERALRAADDLVLPAKFGFVVDAGPVPQLQDCAADIRVERSGADLLLVADGARLGCPVTVDTAAAAAINLARWFVTQGGAPEGRGRMHHLIARRGPPPSHTSAQSSPRCTSAPQPLPGQVASGLLVALEFGQITAQSLAALAHIGPLRLTPWRMILIEAAQTPARLPKLPANLSNLPDLSELDGVILDATDPRLQVRACTGAPGCLQALSSTRDLARDLASFVPEGQVLHVSGCAKGCAQPRPADLVLCATGPDRFNLIHHGTAGDQPLQDPLSAADLRANRELLTKGS